MLGYIFQVISFQLLFLLVYELLLKKETFFTWNRWYLLLTALISLLLPFLRIEELAVLVPEETVSGITNVWLPEVFIGQEPQTLQQLPAVNLSEQGTSINWWLAAYALGVLGSLILLFRKYRDLSRLFKFQTITSEKSLRIIEVPQSCIACTFFNTVFLGDQLSEAEKRQILSHELVHVKQKHSLDLLFFEVLKIIFWFNPLVFIYQSRITILHEFIADAAVVETTGKRNYYEQLLNSAFNTTNISFTNQFFNHSLIKKRIVMLQKSKSKTIAKIKYLTLVPLMLVMLTIVSCTQEDARPLAGEESMSEQLDKLLLTIEESEEISPEDRKKILELTMAASKKSGDPSGANYLPFNKTIEKGADVPFAVIDQVPIFPGCENLGSNEEQKKCMSEKISEYVNKNFNTGLGNELGLTGINRIIVQFKIDKTGNVVEARARAPHPALEEEAIRVINSIPEMQPGKQRGEEVGVMYSLPIVFQVGE